MHTHNTFTRHFNCIFQYKGTGVTEVTESYHFTRTLTHTHTQSFNGLFSRTTWVGRYQKDKPFWILLKQEMMEWQWHHPDHMQIICTLLQTDNHASTSSLNFLTGRMPFLRPTNSINALKASFYRQVKLNELSL